MAVHSSLAIAAVAATLVISLGSGDVAHAQTTPLPTYDYDANVAGIQPPKSPLVQEYDQRVFRGFQLNFGVYVPLADLQAVLPAGFTAIASPSGSNTALLSIVLVFDQLAERSGRIDGPSSILAVLATARNASLARNEQLMLANEQNDANGVASANDLFGKETTRLAKVETTIEDTDGVIELKFDVSDEGLGLRLRVRAAILNAPGTAIISDPLVTPIRAVNGSTAEKSFFQSTRFTVVSAPITSDNLHVHIPGHTLRLAGGNVKALQLGTTLTLYRWRENFTKLEGGQ